MLLLGLISCVQGADFSGGCPAIGDGYAMPDHHPVISRILPEPSPGFVEALAQLDTNAVKADITALLTSSEEFWPADYGNYVGLLSVSRGTVPAHTG